MNELKNKIKQYTKFNDYSIEEKNAQLSLDKIKEAQKYEKESIVSLKKALSLSKSEDTASADSEFKNASFSVRKVISLYENVSRLINQASGH